jgi:hypothetical protein
MQLGSPKLLLVQHVLDMTQPRFALLDGQQKARARALCRGDFCWQMDCDEVVHEADWEKIGRLAAGVPRGIEIVSLPVIEYWGGSRSGQIKRRARSSRRLSIPILSQTYKSIPT